VLPQSEKISQTQLIAHLAFNGYKQCDNIPCLFRHITRDTTFSLVVDDFGVSYLIKTLRKLYDITVQPYGETYLDMEIQFNTRRTAVTVSMPGYIQKNFTAIPTKLPLTQTPRSQNTRSESMSHPYTDLNYHSWQQKMQQIYSPTYTKQKYKQSSVRFYTTLVQRTHPYFPWQTKSRLSKQPLPRQYLKQQIDYSATVPPIAHDLSRSTLVICVSTVSPTPHTYPDRMPDLSRVHTCS
jgi:hypothetical protein